MIVPAFTKTAPSGLVVEMKSASVDEAHLEIDYLKRVCAETRFLLSEPEDVTYTLEGEEAYIKSCEDNPRTLMLNAYLLCESGRVFVGNGAISPVNDAKRLCHRASLGIAIFQEYCGMGIGRLLMEALLEKAKEIGYESVELEVFAKNERAIALYKKMGFTECGRVRNGIHYKDDSYDDEVKMQFLFT